MTDGPADANDAPLVTLRFAQACALAIEVHGGTPRKGTAIPYLSHVLSVSALVMEHGGSEDEAIAALLHDTVEDAGDVDDGEAMLVRIRDDFGEVVAGIVAACSDSRGEPKPPWEERKRAYLAGIARKPEASRLVACCDKLHNARCILRDLQAVGDALWERFSSDRDATLWYYRELAARFAEAGPAAPAAELAATVAEIERLAGR